MVEQEKIKSKGLINVIRITKEEAAYIRENVPGACIAITNRQSSHKKYYAEESKRVFGALARFRGGNPNGRSGKRN